mmetsp:Transcript_133/g.456  ORF Transcript_133/g.456 Transcript_133/m.456 type:complete len:278 (-) Transcript_133:698-1531(-)
MCTACGNSGVRIFKHTRPWALACSTAPSCRRLGTASSSRRLLVCSLLACAHHELAQIGGTERLTPAVSCVDELLVRVQIDAHASKGEDLLALMPGTQRHKDDVVRRCQLLEHLPERRLAIDAGASRLNLEPGPVAHTIMTSPRLLFRWRWRGRRRFVLLGHSPSRRGGVHARIFHAATESDRLQGQRRKRAVDGGVEHVQGPVEHLDHRGLEQQCGRPSPQQRLPTRVPVRHFGKIGVLQQPLMQRAQPRREEVSKRELREELGRHQIRPAEEHADG